MNRTSVLSLSVLAATTFAWLPPATAQLNEKPASPPAAMALAKQLNEAYVSVFERVAPPWS